MKYRACRTSRAPVLSRCWRLVRDLCFAKLRPAVRRLNCQLRSGDNPGSMIILLLHLLRLLPVLCCGHRQLALENLALRHQLAVYKRTVTRPRLRKTDRLFRGRAGQSLGRVEPAPGDRDSRHRPAVAAAPFPRVLGPSFPAAPPAARASTTRLGPWSRAWPPQTFSGAPREFMVSFSSSVSTWPKAPSPGCIGVLTQVG